MLDANLIYMVILYNMLDANLIYMVILYNMLDAAKYIGAGIAFFALIGADVACFALIGAMARRKMRLLMRVNQVSRCIIRIWSYVLSLYKRRPCYLVSIIPGLITTTEINSTLASSTVGAATATSSIIETGTEVSRLNDPLSAGLIIGVCILIVAIGACYNL